MVQPIRMVFAPLGSGSPQLNSITLARTNTVQISFVIPAGQSCTLHSSPDLLNWPALEWKVFDVPPPTLTLNVSNATPILHWTGLTNVTYTVQRSTNLFSTWSTIGWIPATQTNLTFTDWLTGPLQFYRFVVP